MADVLSPIAPPAIDTPSSGLDNAVAPGAYQPPPDLNSLYEDAANSGDATSMYSLTNRAKGTQYEAPIKHAADVMNRNLTAFQETVAPVIKAGGANTPEGRIAASKTVTDFADKPDKMRAFTEMLLGNPLWRVYASGGNITTKVGYDNQGGQLEVQTNEFGKPVGYIDSATNKPLTKQELAARGGLVPSLDAALGYQTDKALNTFNTDALNKSTEATSAYAAKAPAQKSMYGDFRQTLQNLYGSDLTNDQRNAISEFTSRSSGYSQTTSTGLNALKQKVDNKNVTLSASEQKSMGAVLGALGMSISADGSIKKANGEAVTKTDLNQAQNTLNNSSNLERNFTQNKNDFINNEVFKDLGAKEKQMLSHALDLQTSLEKTQMELTTKHGTLPFLINPKTYEIGDQFTRGQAQALIGEFNSDATAAYSEWRDKKLDVYRKTKTVPRAGELEALFSTSPEMKALKADYAEKNRAILSPPTSERASTNSETATSANWNTDLKAPIAPPTPSAPKAKTSIKDLAATFRK